MTGPVLISVAALVAILLWTVRPDRARTQHAGNSEAAAFLADRSGWVISLLLLALATVSAYLAFVTTDSGFRVMMVMFAVFSAARVSHELIRRLAATRRLAAQGG